MNQGPLGALVERELERIAGLQLFVEEEADRLVMSGIVGSEEERQAALDIAHAVAGDRARVEDNIDIGDALPAETRDTDLSETEVGGFRGATPGLEEDEDYDAANLTDQDTLASADYAPGPEMSADSDHVSEGDNVYVPPTDPVAVRRNEDTLQRTRGDEQTGRWEDPEVVGGLQRSSMDETAPARSALDGAPGDEAIREAVLRELREDAATTGLNVDAVVVDGVVVLQGTVTDVEEAESAEEVAARVPGVVEVAEQLRVEALEE